MKQTTPDQFSIPLPEGVSSQNAALCWRMHRDRVQVLLITSRDTGRWIVPKGWPISGKTPFETAAIEAWEEAGVQGAVDASAPLGFYSYDKLRTPKDPIPCHVSVFALRVASLADKFPERKQRRRKWFDAQKAALKVMEPELRSLLAQLAVAGPKLVCTAERKKRA
ncbi:NUDIX hydrolase [Pseudotabrizicola sp.]|uniref:NUDIX hydrolase n=1 Tax=Pseudotabrizicola sp. TaxID=2939647 RepID=UPI00271A91C0|nr:NUDIX hydrolase [Pseudotabrizicola sp.]MDO8884953.1 NUDIX hydrolase [Pseudotabrizicola sp.]